MITVQRFEKIEFAAWLGIAVNLILALIKGIAGWLSGSRALLADAVHSVSDVLGSFRRTGPMTSIVVSSLLLVAGLEIGISALKSMYRGIDAAPSWTALAVIVISFVVKELLFQFKYRTGKRLSNRLLMEAAWERRSDVYSSLAALVGVGGAILGSYINAPVLYYMDPLAALWIAFLVARTGFRVSKQAWQHSLDRVVRLEDADDLISVVQRVRGVICIDELCAREHGHYVVVEVKIRVNPRITVSEGQDIAKAVKYQLLKHFTHVSDVTVHVNPYDQGYPYKSGGVTEQDELPTLIH